VKPAAGQENTEVSLNTELPNGKTIIYRPYFKTKDGRTIWARDYGKKVFRIVIDRDKVADI